MAAVYKGSLKLDKVTGVRHDKGQRITYVPVKQDTSLPATRKSMKAKPNIKNGAKYS